MSKLTDIWLIKTSNGTLLPFQDSDYQIANKLKVGEETCFTLKRIRVPGFHRKYFALINLAFENQAHYSDVYVFRKVMEMRAGYYTPIKTERGHDLAIPKSIAYSEINQDEFTELYEKVYLEVEKLLELVKEEDKEMFQSELSRFV